MASCDDRPNNWRHPKWTRVVSYCALVLVAGVVTILFALSLVTNLYFAFFGEELSVTPALVLTVALVLAIAFALKVTDGEGLSDAVVLGVVIGSVAGIVVGSEVGLAVGLAAALAAVLFLVTLPYWPWS